MLRSLRVCFLLTLILFTSTARGHYLWVLVDASHGEHGTANIYFEEAPRPGDGEYLDPFVARGKSWVRAADADEPTPLQVEETKEPKLRWLSGKLPEADLHSVDSYGQWGVYRYGKNDVLLHYYARYLAPRDHEELHALSRAEHLDLDIVAHEGNGQMELTVLWLGEPAIERDVFLRGPQKFSLKLKTDAKGRVRFKPVFPGIYTARTSVEEPEKSGEFEGKAYQFVRHNATLTLKLPIE